MSHIKLERKAIIKAKSEEQTEVLLCDKCKNEVDQVAQCEHCLTWFCTNCENVEAIYYQCIMAKNNQMHWFCKESDNITSKAIASFNHEDSTNSSI